MMPCVAQLINAYPGNKTSLSWLAWNPRGTGPNGMGCPHCAPRQQIFDFPLIYFTAKPWVPFFLPFRIGPFLKNVEILYHRY